MTETPAPERLDVLAALLEAEGRAEPVLQHLGG